MTEKSKQNQKDSDSDFSLQAMEPAEQKTRKRQTSRKKKTAKTAENKVLSYRHDDKRKNNPHVGMVDVQNDSEEEKTTWAYDPHLAPELQFDPARAAIETLIDNALASDDSDTMRTALKELKRLQTPFLNWSGKAERGSFEVDTVSLHVHERMDPATILAAVRKRLATGQGEKVDTGFQSDMFHAPFENLPLRDAIDFYKHDRDWANRLIAGDSLLVMNSLLQKEGMAGQVQMIYIDPPYGIKYGSNFQPFTNKRDVTDGKDQDLTQEPEMIKAFRDTWELGLHSYLTYMRDRLLLSRELISDSGSIFVQISDENLHHLRELMDEIFGEANFISLITFRKKTMQFGSKYVEGMSDYLLLYAKSADHMKFNPLYQKQSVQSIPNWNKVRLGSGDERKMSQNEWHDHSHLPIGSKPYRSVLMRPSGYSETMDFPYTKTGIKFQPAQDGCWSTTELGMSRLDKANRVLQAGKNLYYKLFHEDYPVSSLTNLWSDTSGQKNMVYAVQTIDTVVQRCILMSTDPGDLVFDPTCGSGTTAYVAEQWGRRWITCDTSRVALTLAKQRLATSSYDYYELKYPNEGLRGGFIYKTVPHVTLKSIANNPEIDDIYERDHPIIEHALADLNTALKNQAPAFEVAEGGRKGQSVDFKQADTETMELPSGETVLVNALLEWEVPFVWPEDWPEGAQEPFNAFHDARRAMQKRVDASIAAHAGQEVLYDQPEVSKTKRRITGPFTVEAVPFATVLGLNEADQSVEADVAVARSGATSRHGHWRAELLKAGIRGKGGQQLQLQDLETLPDTSYIHAVGTVSETGEKVVVSFGPEYAALEQRQVEIAMREAGQLFPLPKMLVFCAFNFDPEAAKDIDNIKGIQALKVQMNTDLLTEDLKKNRASNESFWLMGQPDVAIEPLGDGQLQVEVNGFDYFDTKTGELKSGGKQNIALWQLDTDYDDRSLFPRQVFFPMAGSKDGWHRLKKDIHAELDEDLLQQFHGTVSVPFEPGDNHCIAVKIVDDRGIESLKVIRLNQDGTPKV
jgi:adenine-specific DNA-methyltransferase